MKKILPIILGMLLAGCGGAGSSDSGTTVPVVSGTTSTTGTGTTTTTVGGTTSTTGTTTTTVGGTTSTTAPISNSPSGAATTTIVVQSSGKCLDVTGGPTATGNGVPIEQWTCTGQANQAWTVKDMGNAQYEIIAGNSGKCLDIVNSNPASGIAIQQRDCTGQPNQLWSLLGIGGSGQYWIHSVLNNANCLSIKGGSDLGAPTNDGALVESAACVPVSSYQTWALEVPLPFKYRSTGKCLEVRGGVQATADGTLMEQSTCTGLSNQLWTGKKVGNLQFQFVAGNSGKCLDLVGGGTGPGTRIQQSQCTSSPTQIWRVENIGNGMTFIASDAGAGCLDITGGSAATDGALAQLTTCTTFELWTIGTPAAFP